MLKRGGIRLFGMGQWLQKVESGRPRVAAANTSDESSIGEGPFNEAQTEPIGFEWIGRNGRG